MLSVILDQVFLACCGFALVIRLLLEPSLNKIESLGQEHIATLVNNLVLFVLTLLFILKKIVLREDIRLPKAFVPLGLFCLIASLSVFYSIDAPSSLLYMFDLWASFFFMLVLVNLLRSTKEIEIIIAVLILLMVIASANAAYEYLVILPKVLAQSPNGIPNADRGVQELLNSHRTPTLFGWPNILAGFVIMILPLTIVFLGSLRSRAIKMLAGIASLLALYALFITMTVSSWIGLTAAVTAFLLNLKKRSLSAKTKTWVILIFLLIAVTLTFTAFKKLTTPGVNSTDSRLQYFTSSWQLIKLHPFLGSGLRSYGVASFTYIKNINGRSFFAHNTFLQIWAELGILGLIVFLGFLKGLWQDALILVQERFRQKRLLTFAIIAGIVGCLVDNLFSYTILKPQVALFWWTLCALLIALKENAQPSSILKTQGTWKKIFLVMTLLGAVMTVRLAWAEYDFFTAVHDIHSGTQLTEAQVLCEEAKKLNPWDKKFDLARAYALYSLFISDHNLDTLRQAHVAALSTEGQVSLGYERDSLLTKINDSSAH